MQYKKGVKIALIILCMFALLFAAGCSREDTAQSHGMSFREKSVTVEKYETYTLELQGAEGKQIEWKTNDESVATVQDGVVCGWQKGNTQILACVDGVEVSCNVIVTDNQYVPVLKLRDSDELALDLGGTYSLQPVLYYNAKEYSEVQYTYSCVGNAVTVDENGVINATEAGEAMVCVQGKWRGNVVDASLTVYVIDVSTAVEVSGKVFDIYLNSRDEEFPASADLGISVFDKDTPIQEKDASIKYIELIMAGDVAGAATVENGVVYAKKIGTTHFVAEYTPAEGEAVRTTVFTVNVHKCPADVYMAPIAGAEYEFFITPMNGINSVKWDEEMGAFHLTNKNAGHDDGRGFLFSGEYIEKILRYTNAKSLVFEVKGDGIHSGIEGANQFIYQAFYPDWYDAGEYLMLGNTDEWQKIEVFFDDIPLDQNGERKSIMLLSTVEGMYIRNIRPMTEGSFLTMDLELTTLGGNWTKDIEIGLYPHSYKGGINEYNNRVTIKAGVKTTVKVRLNDFLEGGKVPGFGLVVYGGPEWDSKLSDGDTPDRHTLKISNLRVTGEQNYSLDLSTASWKTGRNGTGFTDANGSGVPHLENDALIIENGFRYDGHKITLDSVDPKERTNICFDMLLTTLSNSTDYVDVCFYPYGFDGDIFTEHTEKIAVKAGKQTTVKLNLDKYLVDGEFSGIGFSIFGGPEWNTELADGTLDRHNIVISNTRLEGKQEKTFNLDDATITTGFANANNGGAASVMDGKIYITGGYRYDGHMISLNEVDTYLKLDVLLTTLSNSTENVGIRFYSYGFDGDVHSEFVDTVNVIAGTKTTIKLDASKYMVDGKLNGIGVAIFGGPEWNTELADGTLDRHNVIISNIRLEGELEKTFDLNTAVVVTGFANANNGGTAVVVDGMVNITGGYRYDGHMVIFDGETEPEVTEPEVTEPPVEEPDTYISIDVLINTLGNSTDPIEVRFYPYNYEGSVHDGYTDLVTVTAGTTTTVKLDASKYLVDGELTGIGFGIFGGPEWNDAAGDRHTVTISSVKLEGAQSAIYDLSQSQIATGNDGTGYTDANNYGSVTIGSSIVFTGGIRYNAHKISLDKAPDTYIVMDLQLDTLGGNWVDPIEIRFFNNAQTDSVHNTYADKISVAEDEKVTVKLNAEKYLVDGELLGFSIGIFGGPEWNDAAGAKHAVTISNLRLEGVGAADVDLSTATVSTGLPGSNSGGQIAIVDGQIVITGGIRYDAHKITFGDETIPEETEPEVTEPEVTEPPVEEPDTYISLDVLINTLGNSADPIDVRFYPYNYEGSVHNGYTDLVTVTAGTTATVKLDASNYLVDGELTGIGFAIFGGPEWNDAAGDRHTVTISNVKLEGEQSTIYDLNQSVVISGQNGTGYTDANGWGSATIGDSIVITGGIRYDAHKISLVEPPDTYIVLDMLLTTLGNSNDKVEIGFFPYNFTGDINGNTDKIAIPAGTQTTVKLDLSKYLVDGAFNGIGFAIFGGPEWNTQLGDGTYDRHSLTISSVKLEGKDAKEFDLSQSVWAKGGDAGYTNANGSGTAEIGSSIVITNGFRYDGHKISLVEDTNTYIVMDLQLDTMGGNWTDAVGIRFYPYNFQGNPHETYTDLVMFQVGEQQTVTLDAEKYLVDGKLTGIGIGIFGGPEWNDAAGRKHTVTISNVKLEGKQSVAYDLSQSTCTSGTVDTGYTNANGWGSATIGDSIVITGGIRYDAHKISLIEKAASGETEQETYIVMDLLVTTLSNSTNPVEMRFCNYSQEDSVHTTYTDLLRVTAGTKTTVRLKVDNYLVDGELPGFGIGIFGGPEWNTLISDGVYDRHSVVISDLRLEGAGARDIDLSAATVATGIPGSNVGGTIAIVDSQIVITGGYRYDGHLITFGAGDRAMIIRQPYALPAKKESQWQQEDMSDPTAP